MAATALGSGIAFLDATVVNVALPTIGTDLDAGLTGLQWTLDGYLVTLTALLLLGGSLGDLYGRRRVFVSGLVWFTVASVVCGLAPSIHFLIAARALQGMGGALLVPGSLALITSSFHPEDRPRAVGAWSGLAGVFSAVAPFLGGWLIDAASWRFIFLINVPLAAVAVLVTLKVVPETRTSPSTHEGAHPRSGRPDRRARPDWVGAATISIALGAGAYALIELPNHSGPLEFAAAVLAVVALIAFVAAEQRSPAPMLPLGVFRSRQFVGANLTTLALYSALGGALFLIVLHLQLVLDYSALEAGAALLPITAMMLILSSRAGALAQKVGPRGPMTVGPMLVAAALVWLSHIGAGDHYLRSIGAPTVMFGLGLALTVSPLTATVLAAVDEQHVGVASGTNNAVARAGGLLAVAVLPALAGIDTDASPARFTEAFSLALRVAAGAAVVGGTVAFVTIRRTAPIDGPSLPDTSEPGGAT